MDKIVRVELTANERQRVSVIRAQMSRHQELFKALELGLSAALASIAERAGAGEDDGYSLSPDGSGLDLIQEGGANGVAGQQ